MLLFHQNQLVYTGFFLTRVDLLKLVSTETLCVYRDTSQAGIIFRSIFISVNLCNCKVHQKLIGMEATARDEEAFPQFFFAESYCSAELY